jgi:hypothetical protein
MNGGRIVRVGEFCKEFSRKINLSQFEWIMSPKIPGFESYWIAASLGTIESLRKSIKQRQELEEHRRQDDTTVPNPNLLTAQRFHELGELLQRGSHFSHLDIVKTLKDSLYEDLRKHLNQPQLPVPQEMLEKMSQLSTLLRGLELQHQLQQQNAGA